MTRTILFLSALPRDAAPLRVDEEIREIQDAISRSRYRDELALVIRPAVRPKDIRQALLAHGPAIVHFSGHGRGEQGVVLEDDDGNSLLVDSDVLAELLALAGRSRIECVLLNACHSQRQVDSIARHIPFVIGTSHAVHDRAAIVFAGAFYQGLGDGESIPFAYELGCNAVRMSGLAVERFAVLARPSRAHEQRFEAALPARTARADMDSGKQPRRVGDVESALASSRPLSGATLAMARTLEGLWMSSGTNSLYSINVIEDRLIVPYCFGGNDSLMAVFYDGVISGDVLHCHFGWLDRFIQGHVSLTMMSQDRLRGHWWSSDCDASCRFPDRHWDSQLGEEHLLKRLPAQDIPRWALAYLRMPVFRKSADRWQIWFGQGAVHHLGDSKGLAYIHLLLKNPGHEYTPIEVHEQVHGRRDEPPSSLTVAADRHTLREYMRRISDLRDRLASTDEAGDPARRQRIEEEIEALEVAVSRTVRAVGPLRRNISDERARKSVSSAIHHALHQISNMHRALAAHLRESLRIDPPLCYAPQEKMTWLT